MNIKNMLLAAGFGNQKTQELTPRGEQIYGEMLTYEINEIQKITAKMNATKKEEERIEEQLKENKLHQKNQEFGY